MSEVTNNPRKLKQAYAVTAVIGGILAVGLGYIIVKHLK